MRSRYIAFLGIAAAAAWAIGGGEAVAKPKIVESVEYYDVSGTTGVDLLREMNRRGPKQGFMTKAIAQTQYKATPQGDMVYQDGQCRVKGGGFSLTIKYVYPRPTDKLPPDLARRWKIFQADNVRHEKFHGAVARELAVKVDQKLRTFAMADGRDCWKAIERLKDEVEALYAAYELRQNIFDKREHRSGGPVEKSILILIGKKGFAGS